MSRKFGNRGDSVFLYGYHSVLSAIRNDERHKRVLYLTESAHSRIDDSLLRSVDVELTITDTGALDKMCGSDSVHQGIVLECKPLDFLDSSETFIFSSASLLVALDQITDPHNVGAIMRTCVAFGVDGIILPRRGGAPQSAVLAKSASGALDMIPILESRTFSKTLTEFSAMGFTIIGLDSQAEDSFPQCISTTTPPHILVFGSEGKGLRQNTRESCTHLAKLEMPGAIKSLNVSNAATLCLSIAKGL